MLPNELIVVELMRTSAGYKNLILKAKENSWRRFVGENSHDIWAGYTEWRAGHFFLAAGCDAPIARFPQVPLPGYRAPGTITVRTELCLYS